MAVVVAAPEDEGEDNLVDEIELALDVDFDETDDVLVDETLAVGTDEVNIDTEDKDEVDWLELLLE